MLEFFRGNKEERTIQEAAKRLNNKRKLTSRDQATLEQANLISRRLFLRKAGAGVLTLVGAGSGAAYIIQNMKEGDLYGDQPSWLTVESLEEISQERVERAIDAARQWNTRYKAGRRVTISPLNISEKERLPDGKIGVTLETAEPGIIKLGREGNSYMIVLHAMTHATKPDNPTLLDTPITFSDGVIRGYHGLNILVTLNNGEETKFTKIEEGMAERNASAFPGYSVEDARYFAVGRLARDHFPFERYRYAHEWAKSNDVPGLVTTRLSLSSGTNLTPAHLETVMTEYMLAWNSGLR